MGKRRSPYRHVVRTKHPRYHVRRYERGHGQPPDITTRKMAKRFHRYERSLKAQKLDEKLDATVTDQYEEWVQTPNRLDIYGVDYFPVEPVPGRPDLTFKHLESALLDYYGYDPKEIPKVTPVFYYTRSEWKKVAPTSIAGRYIPKKGDQEAKIILSPPVSKLILRGKIEDREDFHALKALVHEYEHHLNLYYRESYELEYGPSFDEGLTELLATRFSMLAFKMDPKLRRDLERNPAFVYPEYVRMVAKTAFVVNDLNEVEAIEWLKKLRSAPTNQKKKMVESAIEKLKRKGFVAEHPASIKDYEKLTELSQTMHKLSFERIGNSEKLSKIKTKLSQHLAQAQAPKKAKHNRRSMEEWVNSLPKEKQNAIKPILKEYDSLMIKDQVLRNTLYKLDSEKRRRELNLRFNPFAVNRKADNAMVVYESRLGEYIKENKPRVSEFWWLNDA